MRIESQVGHPTAAGEPAEEKSAPAGAGGLFVSLMDCFRALLSGPLPEDSGACCEAPVASAKSIVRSQVALRDASSLPAMPETAVARESGVGAEDSISREGRKEGFEACTVPVSISPAMASFHLAVPKVTGNGQPAVGTPDPAMFLTGATGHEDFSAAASRMRAGLTQQPGVPGFAVDRQGVVPPSEISTSQMGAEGREASTASAGGTPAPDFNTGSIAYALEAVNLQAFTQAASRAELSAAVQSATPAVMIDVSMLQPDGSSGTAPGAPIPSSFSAHVTTGMPIDSGTTPKAGSPAASATGSVPQRSGNPVKANVSQPGGRSAKREQMPGSTAAPDGPGAYTRATPMDNVAGPAVDPNFDERPAGPHLSAQKLRERVLPTSLDQSPEQPEAANRPQSRPGATNARADAQLPSQAEPAAQPAGVLKASNAVNAATPAAEVDRALAARGRLRTTVEGGARSDSSVSLPSGTARDAQISPQATTGVKDVKAPAFMFEVAERISAFVAGGRGEITVQLKPDQFGRMNIVAESGASGILARITTESASVKQYLESNLPVLQQALQEQGLKVERIDVMVQEGLSQQQSANQWQQNFGHPADGHESGRHARFASPAPTQSNEPVREITLDAVTLGALHPHSTFHTVA